MGEDEKHKSYCSDGAATEVKRKENRKAEPTYSSAHTHGGPGTDLRRGGRGKEDPTFINKVGQLFPTVFWPQCPKDEVHMCSFATNSVSASSSKKRES